jgi:hypothetical protein
MVAEAARLPADNIVLLLSLFADGQGARMVPKNAAAAIAVASNAPVYSFYDTYSGTGIIGGYIQTYESVGMATGDAVLQVLLGTHENRPNSSVDVKSAFRVDARAMQRWGLSRDNLPPDSIVSFHEPSIWEPIASRFRQYRWSLHCNRWAWRHCCFNERGDGRLKTRFVRAKSE